MCIDPSPPIIIMKCLSQSSFFFSFLLLRLMFKHLLYKNISPLVHFIWINIFEHSRLHSHFPITITMIITGISRKRLGTKQLPAFFGYFVAIAVITILLFLLLLVHILNIWHVGVVKINSKRFSPPTVRSPKK